MEIDSSASAPPYPGQPRPSPRVREVRLAPEAYTETAGAGKQKAAVGGEGFEKRIKGRIPDLDMAVWRERMAQIEVRVCRVEINNRAAGTGFLVGPEAVMTNWHVVKNVIEGRAAAAAVNCRFDYKQYADGTRSEGVTVGLHATEWKQDFSPYSAADGPRTTRPRRTGLRATETRPADRE